MRRNSGIGGQAVLEGVMMRNKNLYAVSCRRSDGEIVTDVKETHSITEKLPFLGWPFIRGTVNLIESMVSESRRLRTRRTSSRTRRIRRRRPHRRRAVSRLPKSPQRSRSLKQRPKRARA